MVRDSLIAALDESDPDQIRALGQLLGVSVPPGDRGGGAGPGGLHPDNPEQAEHPRFDRRALRLRLLDYEARGQQEYQWQTDEGFRQYVSLLIELGYQPSDIERELLDTWTADAEAAGAEDGAAPAAQLPEHGIEEVAVTS